MLNVIDWPDLAKQVCGCMIGVNSIMTMTRNSIGTPGLKLNHLEIQPPVARRKGQAGLCHDRLQGRRAMPAAGD